MIEEYPSHSRYIYESTLIPLSCKLHRALYGCQAVRKVTVLRKGSRADKLRGATRMHSFGGLTSHVGSVPTTVPIYSPMRLGRFPVLPYREQRRIRSRSGVSRISRGLIGSACCPKRVRWRPREVQTKVGACPLRHLSEATPCPKSRYPQPPAAAQQSPTVPSDRSHYSSSALVSVAR